VVDDDPWSMENEAYGQAAPETGRRQEFPRRVSMASRIHLIEKQGRMKPVRAGSAEYESGYWVINPETANRLIGGEIYFHKAQAAPAYFGGVIQSWRIQPEGEFSGRVIFLFLPDGQRFRGTLAGREGWGREKKIVF
jgi:hypothetical protein